jgi:hypothetical protein
MAPIVAPPAIEPTTAGRKSTTSSKPAAEANTFRPSAWQAKLLTKDRFPRYQNMIEAVIIFAALGSRPRHLGRDLSHRAGRAVARYAG